MTDKITAQNIFDTSPIIPVMVIHDVNDAIPLAEALIEGGIRIFEITLRTKAALPQIQFGPIGGINQHNLADYSALPCVTTVGGTWILPSNIQKGKNWSAVTTADL